MKKKILFIINPVSGGKNKDHVPRLIEKNLDLSNFDFEIAVSASESNSRQLAIEGAKVNDIIVAVGGDGTVNETASAIAGTDKILGIIPFGSGNGLARFLNIPIDVVKAIKTINKGRTELIDAGKVNGRWFFNMAGMGFDAHISEVFSHDRHRGFQTYFKSSIHEINTYRAQNYRLDIDGDRYDREAFMLSFANSSQYGNNAHVSPMASVQDGLIDVCVIKPFPIYKLPEMGLRMFTKTADKSDYVEIIRGKNVLIKRELAGPVHLDGEPQMLGTEAEVNIVPK